MRRNRSLFQLLSHRFVLGVAIFSLLALIACSRSTSQNSSQAVMGDNALSEDSPAIQRFVASAPSKSSAVSKPMPTQVVVTQTTEQDLPLPEVDPFLAAGDLRITGSPTLAGVTEAIYSRFVTAGYNSTIKIEEVGTTPGFRRYCETSEADLMLAARPIQESELRLCMLHGRQPVALLIAMNAMVVVVNPNNAFVEDVSLEDLRLIFSDAYWNEANSAWPAKKIVRFLPDTNFGIFGNFADQVVGGDSQLLQKAPLTRLLSDQSEVIQEISDNNDAVGFVDYPYYQANQKLLKAVAINGVKPDQAAIKEQRYSLLNPLLIYTDAQTLQAKPQLGAFLLFYLTYLNKDVSGAGNFAVSTETLNRSKILLLSAMGNQAYVDELRHSAEATSNAAGNNDK